VAEMKKSTKIILTAILIIISVVIIVGVLDKAQKPQTNQALNTSDISNLPLTMSISQVANSTESLNQFNISKGQTLILNVNVAVNSEHPELTLPLYLSIGAFENKPSAKVIACPPSPYPSIPWPSHDDSPNITKPFEATFNPNPIICEPNQNAAAILTITALDEAQTGTYSLSVEIGNYKETSVGATMVYLTVLPEL
jgi:hypothetical protein